MNYIFDISEFDFTVQVFLLNTSRFGSSSRGGLCRYLSDTSHPECVTQPAQWALVEPLPPQLTCVLADESPVLTAQLSLLRFSMSLCFVFSCCYHVFTGSLSISQFSEISRIAYIVPVIWQKVLAFFWTWPAMSSFPKLPFFTWDCRKEDSFCSSWFTHFLIYLFGKCWPFLSVCTKVFYLGQIWAQVFFLYSESAYPE